MPSSDEPVTEVTPSVTDTITAICNQLIILQRRRRFAIQMANRLNNATAAFVREVLHEHDAGPQRAGFTKLSETERTRIRTRATALIKAVREGTAPAIDDDLLLDISTVVQRNDSPCALWSGSREAYEATMQRLTEQLLAHLPLVQWLVEDTRGFTAKGVAVILGEAGDLSRYHSEGALYKRLGLSVLAGQRQGRVPSDLTGKARAEAWSARGYSPSRRSQVWAFVDDMLVRAQVRGGVARGRYGSAYLVKKAEYLVRYEGQKGGKMHADMAARRYMARKFIRDLFRVWQRAKRRLS